LEDVHPQEGAKAQKNTAIPVIAATPIVKDITVYLESIGTLQPSVLMEIKSQTNGLLKKVLISEGDWVQKGTPLFKIDPKLYEIKVQEAEAQLAIDRASYLGIQKKLDRYRDLAEKDLVAKTEWEDLEAQGERALAVIDLDAARLNSAKLDLDNCTLKSPIAGRVGKLDAHPGLLVSGGQALVSISKMDPLIVEFTITEKEFAKVPRDALNFEIKPLCLSDSCVGGKVTFLDNHFDSKTGLLLIRGEVQNSDHALRPGQSVNVRLPIAVTSQTLLIPQKAVRYNQQGPYAYVVQDDMTVALRQLILGSEHGNEQIVIEGIVLSERIILEGHLRLSPGLKVEVK